jgi:SPP1 family predicted phage head-tail adaptor
VRSGKLRHQIAIMQAVETRSATGQPVVTWATFATVFASVEPLRGREFFASKQIQAQVDVRIRIRYLEGVVPKMRVIFGTKTYLIDSVIDPEERHIEMQIMAQEVV